MKKGRLIKILVSGTALVLVVGVFIIYFIGFIEPTQSVEEVIPSQKNSEEQLSRELDRVDQSGGMDELPGIVDKIGLDKEPAEEEKDNLIVDKTEQKDKSTQTHVKPTEPEKPVGDTKPVEPDKPKVDIPDRVVNPNKDQDAQSADGALLKEMIERAKNAGGNVESKRTDEDMGSGFDPIQAR